MSLEWKHVLLYTLSLGGGGEVLHKLIGLCHGPTNPTRARDIQCYGLEGCSKQKPGHQWNNETLTFFMAWGCWCGDHFVITNWCRYIRMSYASIAHWVFDLSFLVQKSKADQVTLYVWCVVWGLNVSVRACVCACMCLCVHVPKHDCHPASSYCVCNIWANVIHNHAGPCKQWSKFNKSKNVAPWSYIYIEPLNHEVRALMDIHWNIATLYFIAFQIRWLHEWCWT